MTLTDFLLARIAEDEAVAQAVLSEYPDGASEMRLRVGEIRGFSNVQIGEGRVLAECEAKRRIVANFHSLDADYKVTRDPMTEARRFQALVSVGELAIAYADHPDYDESWRP